MLDELLRHPILFARSVVRRIKEIPSKGLPKLHGAKKDDFDRKYGVETAKLVRIVPTDSPNFSHGSKYEAAPETVIRWCIENCSMRLNETTFVDLGSGKGRALIVATSYPFEKIIGVEYSSQLAAVCRQNLQKLGIANKCAVVGADAVDYKFPDGNLLVFLYNHFDNTILERVIKNLANTMGRTQIAQLGPGHDLIKKSGLAQVICSGEGPTLYEILKSGRSAT
jgi:SAM-dependent methyltransferase